MRKLLSLCAGLALSLALDAGAGKLYRWVDKDGHVHFGDQPPPQAQEISPKTPETTNTEAANAAAAEKRAAECQRKKTQLAGYTNALRVTETNGLGETREYSDEERRKLIELTERQVREACGESPG